MKKLLITFAALLGALASNAQETYCFAQRDTCSLYLDIWRPTSASVDARKPTVLYVFGGGFISGSRKDPTAVKWFGRLCEEGYSVVSIDYRLGMKGYKMGKGLAGASKALGRFVLAQRVGVEDVFSAVSYLAGHPELGIATDNLVISGSSAGAIISLASAYAIANGQTEGLPEGFNFKGVMSFAGGIISDEGAPRYSKAPCPLLLLHGTADNAVAYEHYGLLGRGIWGSSYIAAQLKKKGWNFSIWRFKDRAHDVAAYMDYLWPVEKEFLEKNVIQGISCSVDALVDDPSLPSWNDWGNISVEDIYQ